MYKKYVLEVTRVLGELNLDKVEEAARIIDRARKSGRWVLLFGHGGSAATASHWANGLQSVGVRAHVLDNVPIITAIANDSSYDQIFRNQLKDAIEGGDVAIGFSCSGNSKDVLLATKLANLVGATTIGLTAFDGGELRTLVAVPVHVPVDSYEISEDIHSIIGHMITLRLKELE